MEAQVGERRTGQRAKKESKQRKEGWQRKRRRQEGPEFLARGLAEDSPEHHSRRRCWEGGQEVDFIPGSSSALTDWELEPNSNVGINACLESDEASLPEITSGGGAGLQSSLRTEGAGDKMGDFHLNPSASVPIRTLQGETVSNVLNSPGANLGTSQAISPEEEWRTAVRSCKHLGQLGALLAWGLHCKFAMVGLVNPLNFAKPLATSVAPKKEEKGIYPLPVDFSNIAETGWPRHGFSHFQCEIAWSLLVTMALNQLYGCSPPFPLRRRGAGVQKSLELVRSRVNRFLSQELSFDFSLEEVWEDVKSKTVSYSGEEVAVAQTLTLNQVIPSMPPLGHGGCVELSPLLTGKSRDLLEHPEKILLPEMERGPSRPTAKVHLKQGEEAAFFELLHERGVITYVDEDEVFSDSRGKYLSGLFGVPKPNKFTTEHQPVLRLIMNLIPINDAMGVILGDIQELPSASVWQQLVLAEDQSLTVSQADMVTWHLLFICFACHVHGAGYVYPACQVLPMGWSSSVGLMQMASRELLLRARLPPGDELRKQSRVPRWFLNEQKGRARWELVAGLPGQLYVRTGLQQPYKAIYG